jgi:hypothetical protein
MHTRPRRESVKAARRRERGEEDRILNSRFKTRDEKEVIEREESW